MQTEEKRKLPGYVVILAALLLGIGGIHLVITAAAPLLVRSRLDIAAIKVQKNSDQLIIPSLGVQEKIFVGGPEVLEKGVWNRYPERGGPGSGNYILSAHRFVMGWWPGETVRKSPFYHLDKLKNGEQFFVDWRGRRYVYEVTRKYQVKPSAIYIEAPSTKPKLTLYSCTLAGSADGRLVVEAKLK